MVVVAFVLGVLLGGVAVKWLLGNRRGISDAGKSGDGVGERTGDSRGVEATVAEGERIAERAGEIVAEGKAQMESARALLRRIRERGCVGGNEGC